VTDLAHSAVTPATAGALPVPGGPLSYIHWGPVIAGAFVAAALSFVLLAFASAVGLAVASPSPTWRDTSVALVLLSGIYILATAVGSFALGGFIAGRIRTSWKTNADEIQFRDGLHGLLVWAVAIVIGALLAWAAASSITSTKVVSSPTQSTASGDPAFLALELDRLFRSTRPEAADPQSRAEAGRIILSGLGHTDISTDDRAFLGRLVAARTGFSQPDADRRVLQIIGESRAAAAQARRSAVILGFMVAAALLAAAVAAWMCAEIGGRHRDQEIAPPLRWTSFGERRF
jgi:hypothetical protein